MFGVVDRMAYNGEVLACQRKVRFGSDAAAQAALKKINPAKASAAKPNRVYKCPVCSGFHLTSHRQR